MNARLAGKVLPVTYYYDNLHLASLPLLNFLRSLLCRGERGFSEVEESSAEVPLGVEAASGRAEAGKRPVQASAATQKQPRSSEQIKPRICR